MADDDNPNQFSGGPALGSGAGGKIESFPLAQLGEKTRAREEEEAAQQYAVEQSEAGFPTNEEDDDDFSDLEEITNAVAK